MTGTSWPAAYVAGLQAGYAARCREESDEWQEETSHRVLVSGQFWERPTAAELRAEREAILREAHAALLHLGRRVAACPVCCAFKPRVMARADLDAAEAAIERGRAEREATSICTVCGRPARLCRPYRGRSCRPTTP